MIKPSSSQSIAEFIFHLYPLCLIDPWACARGGKKPPPRRARVTQNGDVRRAFHDYVAGWGMIVLAAALFFCVLWYLDKLIREEGDADIASLVRQAKV